MKVQLSNFVFLCSKARDRTLYLSARFVHSTAEHNFNKFQADLTFLTLLPVLFFSLHSQAEYQPSQVFNYYQSLYNYGTLHAACVTLTSLRDSLTQASSHVCQSWPSRTLCRNDQDLWRLTTERTLLIIVNLIFLLFEITVNFFSKSVFPVMHIFQLFHLNKRFLFYLSWLSFWPETLLSPCW